MHRFLLLICGILILTGSLVAQKKTVGVLELNSTGGISKNETSALTNRFRAMLVQTESFTVLEREKMNDILKEQDFIAGDNCNTAECAVQIGQLLGVEKIIAGDMGKVGNTYTIDMRLVDVKTGAIEKSVSNDFKGEVDGLLTLMNEVAGVFAGISAQLRTASRSGTADVYVNSSPEGAEILIDNTSTGLKTPALVENLTKGFHTIYVQKNGLVGSQFLEFVEGSIPTAMIELTRPKISIKLLSKPIGVFVVMGKDTLGKTPMIYTVPIGESAVKFVYPGYADSIIPLTLRESDAGEVLNIEMAKLVGCYVQTSPSKARVYLDKKLVGYSPCVVPMDQSAHALVIEATGFFTYRKTVRSAEPNLQINLISKDKIWKASINSDPKNANVYLHGLGGAELIGTTPLHLNWKSEANQITIQKSGYKKVTLDITPYEPEIDVELEKE